MKKQTPIETICRSAVIIIAMSLIGAMLCSCNAKSDPSPSPAAPSAPWQALEPTVPAITLSPTQKAEPTPTPNATQSPSPAVTSELPPPAIAEEPSLAPLAANPVAQFFSDYNNAAQDILTTIKFRLANEFFTKEGLELSLMCDFHSVFSSLLWLSIGNIEYNDDSNDSAILTKTDYGYAFEVRRDDGNLLAGAYYDGDYVEFTLSSATKTIGNCKITKTQDGWSCAVDENGYKSEFFIFEKKAVFTCGEISAVFENGMLGIESQSTQ